ncbi:MAG TPA: tetratricopeptide repeat protein [Candidatus Binatia bacterium]
MPTSAELYGQAVDCVADGKLDEAISKYKEALTLDPTFADVWEGLSMAYADKELWPEAIEAAKNVVAISPDDQLGYTNLSRIFQRSGNVPEAEAWAAKARILDWKAQVKEGK